MQACSACPPPGPRRLASQGGALAKRNLRAAFSGADG